MRLGLLARIILIVAVALFAIQLVALAVFFGLGGSREAFGESSPALPRRVAALVVLVDKAPAELRPIILDAFNESGRTARILPELPQDVRRSMGGARIAQAIRVALALRGAPDREAEVQVAERADGRHTDTLAIHVRLTSGEYLLLDVEDRVTVRLLGVPIGFFAGLFGVLVAAAALIAVAREMRPLTRLAREVDRVGEHVDPVRIGERGAPEVRALIRAVNAMQERIANLLRNRTLTLGAISHDLRTYLTRLRLRVEMMPESRHRAGAIADVEAMQALVRETLDFAQAAFAQSESAKADLAAVLRRFCAGHGDAARITLDLPGTPVPAAMGDKALARVCANLIENALRYGGSAYVRAEAAPGWVTLVVEDEGPGIPPEERAHVFEPFYRLETSRNRESGGTGLGLTIVGQIVELYGGRVELGDSVRGGLAVHVAIPASVSAD